MKEISQGSRSDKFIIIIIQRKETFSENSDSKYNQTLKKIF